MTCTYEKGICKEHNSNYNLCHVRTAELLTELWDAKKREQDYYRKLLDILALIHRDGGHYSSEHGLTQSFLDAAEIRGRQMNAMDQMEKALEKILEYTTMHQTWCQRTPACSCGLLNATNAAREAISAAKKCEQPPEGYMPVILNEYHAKNLLLLLNVCGYPYTEGVGPFKLMSNGDWVGEIALKIARFFFGDRLIAPQANTTRERLVNDVKHWLTHAKPEDIK